MKKVWSILAATIITGGAAVMIGSGSLNAATGASASLSRHDDEEAIYKQIMENAGPALVTVKFVLKVEGGSADFMQGLNDQEMETTGLLIDGKGLVVCSNLQMGGYYSLMSRGGGPTVTPNDVKVLIGDDTEGKKAKVLTRDTELDLAWVKLDEDSTTELKHVDMSKGATASAGTKVFLIQKMAKFFDRALAITEGKVTGMTEKPRKLLAPSKALASAREDLGMPVFNSAGTVVGMVVLQIPDQESMEGDTSGDLGGGPMILPAAEVVKATARALEAAAKSADAKPAEGEKKPDAPADAKPTEEPKKDK